MIWTVDAGPWSAPCIAEHTLGTEQARAPTIVQFPRKIGLNRPFPFKNLLRILSVLGVRKCVLPHAKFAKNAKAEPFLHYNSPVSLIRFMLNVTMQSKQMSSVELGTGVEPDVLIGLGRSHSQTSPLETTAPLAIASLAEGMSLQ